MDKKNTMLLTVIAIATLLVAVVGATFAYFAISTTNNTNTTNITGTTEKVGVVALDLGEGLKLNLSATDMSQATAGETGKHFCSVATSAEGENSKDCEEADNFVAIASAMVTGGEAETVYDCSATLTVNVSGTADTKSSMQTAFVNSALTASSFLEGEAVVKFQGHSGIEGVTFTENDIDLSKGLSTTTDVTFKVTGANTTTTPVIDAELKFFNSTAEQQDRLANMSATITITSSEFTCKPAAS